MIHRPRIFKAGLQFAVVWVALVLFFSPQAAQAFNTVVIDAGHGGHDRGGIPGQRVPEKVVALDVAKRVNAYLKRAGVRTVMTRNSDVFIPLSTRVAMGNRQRDAIFVSIHFNSAHREGAQGYETFYYSKNSYSLAARIQRNLLRVNRTEDRGVKRRGFYVLRNSRIPAVLVECGFLTNASEAKLAQSASHRDKLARAISSAILEAKRAGR